MKPLRDVIRAYAQENVVICTEGSSTEQPSVLLQSFLTCGNCCLMWVTVAVDEAERQIDIIVTGSLKAPRVRIPQVSRFLELANEDDSFGRFVFDVETGAVIYATSALVGEMDLDADAIGFAVRTAGTRYDRLYPGLVQVINADAAPDKLWPLIERPDWGRINREYNSLKHRVPWDSPADIPALEGVLSLPR